MPAFPGRSLCSPGHQLADESSVLVSASVLFTLSSRPVSLLIFSYGNEPQQPSVGEVVSLPSSALMQGTRVQEAAPASPPRITRVFGVPPPCCSQSSSQGSSTRDTCRWESCTSSHTSHVLLSRACAPLLLLRVSSRDYTTPAPDSDTFMN